MTDARIERRQGLMRSTTPLRIAARWRAVCGCFPAFAGALLNALGALPALASDDVQLQEVVVTAQRRGNERLLDTPISVGVLSGSDLDAGSSRGVSDVLNQVGGVSVIETEPGNSQIAIRGVVPDQYTGTSTTGYYLDEVPFAFVTTAQLPDINDFDLSRVEVLRGPQGTLYGVNALGGVVRVLTNDADLDAFGTKVRLRGSDTDYGRGNGGADGEINIPLIPGELGIRAVAGYSYLSGYIASSITGETHINDSKDQSYRVKLGFKPNDFLTLKLGVTRSQLDNGAPSQSNSDLTTPFPGDQQDRRVYDTYNAIAELHWETVSLLSSTSYFDYSANTNQGLDLAATLPIIYFQHFGLNSVSQEFRLSSHLQDPWQWSAGALYKDTTQTLSQNVQPYLPGLYEEKNESKSYAVFGELTRAFSEDQLELTGGLRYFNDRLVSTDVSNFFGSPLLGPRPANFDHVTGRFVLTYKPQKDQMLYSSITSGFRSGLNQTAEVAAVEPAFPSTKPDSLITYEVGSKGALRDSRVTYDLAVYYTDWKDIQQGLILPIGFFAGVNAGKASGMGVDGSLAYQPVDGLTLQANIGWNGLKLDADVLQPGGSAVLFYSGDRLNDSAEWTGSVSGSYRAPTPVAGMNPVVSASYTYRSSIVLRYLTGPALTTSQSEAIGTLKAGVGLESAHWSVQLYGDNLTNNRNAVTPPDPTYGDNSVRLRPLTVGLQTAFRF